MDTFDEGSEYIDRVEPYKRRMLHSSRIGSVLCLTVDHPPYNLFNRDVLAALYQALERAAAEPLVRGVVLAAAGRIYSAGGDVRELGMARLPGKPDVTDVVDRIAHLGKPVAIALHGKAIGASVLIALACDVRIGTANTVITLPEVKLGFTPRAGGTQRLLRLVGPRIALEMMALAESIDAQGALRAGLIDAVAVDGRQCVEQAAERISLSQEGRFVRRESLHLPIPSLATGETAEGLAEHFRKRAAMLFPGRAAPLAAIELVSGSLACSIEDGLRLEQETYRRLFASDEARRLRGR